MGIAVPGFHASSNSSLDQFLMSFCVGVCGLRLDGGSGDSGQGMGGGG